MRPIVYPVTAADVANGATIPLPVDYNRAAGQYMVQYQNAGSPGAGTLQASIDNPFTPPSGGMTWFNVPLSFGRANVTEPVLAFHILGPSSGDVVTIVAQGAGTAG